jgi:hypothetical protein
MQLVNSSNDLSRALYGWVRFPNGRAFPFYTPQLTATLSKLPVATARVSWLDTARPT